jgi:twitching motility protein PilT
MLDEIVEDEKVSTSKRKKVSQADIKRLLTERESTRQAIRDSGTGPSIVSSGTPEPVDHAQVSEQQGRKPAYPPGEEVAAIDSFSGLAGAFLQGHGHTAGHQDICNAGGHFRQSQIPLNVLPSRILLKYRVVPLHEGSRVIELAMENPEDGTAIHHVETLTGKRVEPVRLDPGSLHHVLDLLRAQRAPTGFNSADFRGHEEGSIIFSLFEMLVISEGSDLIITKGTSPWLKTPIRMERTELPEVTPLECVQYAKSLMDEDQWEQFLAQGFVRFSMENPVHGRFRVQVHRERSTPSLVIRHIPDTLPTLDELGLPEWLEGITQAASGLIVIAGPSGHGRTTSLHALVHRINSCRTRQIVTIEDPLEYIHRSIMSQISQREIGKDVTSYVEGIQQARKHGADVIVVGELSSPDVIMESLAAAQSGRLVLTALEACNARQALQHLIRSVPSPMKSEGKSVMEEVPFFILAQKLLMDEHGATVRPVCEKLEGSSRLGDLPKSLPTGPSRNSADVGDRHSERAHGSRMSDA